MNRHTEILRQLITSQEEMSERGVLTEGGLQYLAGLKTAADMVEKTFSIDAVEVLTQILQEEISVDELKRKIEEQANDIATYRQKAADAALDILFAHYDVMRELKDFARGRGDSNLVRILSETEETFGQRVKNNKVQR